MRTKQLVIETRDNEKARKALIEFEICSANGRIILKDERAVKEPDMVATLLVQAGMPPTHLAVEQENLEEYFLRLTR